MEYYLLIEQKLFIQQNKKMDQLNKTKIKTIFFGTHEFATIILKGLLNDPRFLVELVITQPDKPVGRKQELQKSPIKILAEKNNLKIEQPESLKNYNLEHNYYDLGITAQYGLIIPKNILEIPKYGIINIHTSLLPKYRGASPIQSSIINGETKTGVTIMKMSEGLDNGPIIKQIKTDIELDETYPDLDKKLADLAVNYLGDTLIDYLNKKIIPQKQNDAEATFCKKLEREDGKIDWTKSTSEIYNLYRGLYPWPGIWTIWKNKRLKLLKIKPANKKLKNGEIDIENKKLYIGTNDGSVEILELQIEGKYAMNNIQFINGYEKIINEEKI